MNKQTPNFEEYLGNSSDRLTTHHVLCFSILVVITSLFPFFVNAQIENFTFHEPNTFGINFDGNDQTYIDINMSFKWTPLNDSKRDSEGDRLSTWGGGVPYFYLAFSTRQAFYLDTRDSSPVIGQRFNPEFFGRYWLKDDGYIDFGYNHESNGQSINSKESFIDKQNDLIGNNENSDFAKEYISRGWDYWELTWKRADKNRGDRIEEASYYVNVKHFLSDGFLQGHAEEVNSWETAGKLLSRSEVDGISFLARLDFNLGCSDKIVCFEKLFYKFTTGYDNAFKRNTNRLELGWKIFDVPLTFWTSDGYNDDLVDYYRRVKSYGVSLELGSF